MFSQAYYQVFYLVNRKEEKNNPLTLLLQESVVVCFAAFPLAVLVLVY